MTKTRSTRKRPFVASGCVRIAFIAMTACGLAGCSGSLQSFEGLAATGTTPGSVQASTPGLDQQYHAELTVAGRLFRNGDFAKAESAYRTAAAMNPARAEAWIGIAAADDRLGRFDLADRAYAQAERVGGRSAMLLNDRGYSYYLRGDRARAKAEFSSAARLSPENPVIMANEALVQTGQGPASAGG